MEKKKVIDLIKLEVLGCINDKDSESLRKMKETENNFPWKELAEYQNLVALLPSTLTIDYPDSELKDKTARKLYDIRDEIKAKLDAKKAKEVPAQPVLEEVSLTEEPEVSVVEEGVQLVQEEVIIEKEPKKTVKDIPEKTEVEVIKPEQENKEAVVSKPAVDRELVEKILRESFKNQIRPELEKIKKDVQMNRLISIIFFAAALLLIILILIIK